MSSTSIRLDDYLDEGQIPPGGAPTISLGEDAVTDPMEEAFTVIDKDAENAKRLVDMQCALEELEEIASNIQEATTTDIALVNNSLKAAMAGTDISPSEIQPGLESFVGRRISTEGIGEFIKSIWEAIVGLIKRIWLWISNFFSGLLGRSARTEKKAATVSDDASKKINSNPKASSVELGSEWKRLIWDGRVSEKLSDFEAGLTSSEALLKDIGKYIAAVNGAGVHLIQSMDKFDESKPTESLKAIIDGLKPVTEETAGLSLKLSSDTRYTGGTFTGYPLLGNKHVVARLPLKNTKEQFKNGSEEAHGVRGTTYKIEDYKAAVGTEGTKSVHAMSGKDCATLATRIEKFTAEVRKANETHSRAVTLGKEKANVEKAGSRLTDRMSRIEDKLSDEAKSAYRDAVKLSETYTGWATHFVAAALKEIELGNEAIVAMLGKMLKNLE
jgi:hypothetical protein